MCVCLYYLVVAVVGVVILLTLVWQMFKNSHVIVGRILPNSLKINIVLTNRNTFKMLF